MFAVAELTIRKIKEPAFFLMLCFSALLSWGFSDMGFLSQETTGEMLAQFIYMDKGYPILNSSIFVFTMALMIAIFAGASDIPRDIDTGLIMLIIAKPITKIHYLFGKYLGILGLCLIFFFVDQLTIFVVQYLSNNVLYSFGIILRQFFLVFALIPLVALTVMISCFVADFSAMVLTSVYLLFSIFFCSIPLLVELLPRAIGVKSYLLLIYYFFPNFVYYFQSFKSFGLINISLLIYTASITAIFLIIAGVRIQSRDLV